MPKVICPNIECENYSERGCKSKTVHLSETHCHTVNMGFQQFWKCKEYKVTENWKEIIDGIEKVVNEMKRGD